MMNCMHCRKIAYGPGVIGAVCPSCRNLESDAHVLYELIRSQPYWKESMQRK